jgi:hypothetical protein
MRFPILLSAVSLFTGAGCSDSLRPGGNLQGTWQTWPLVPSGSGVNMSLTMIGSVVSGAGRASELQRDLGPLTITGQQDADGAFRLTVRYDQSGATATYSGHVVGSDALDGQWTGASQSSYSLTFKRQSK